MLADLVPAHDKPLCAFASFWRFHGVLTLAPATRTDLVPAPGMVVGHVGIIIVTPGTCMHAWTGPCIGISSRCPALATCLIHRRPVDLHACMCYHDCTQHQMETHHGRQCRHAIEG